LCWPPVRKLSGVLSYFIQRGRGFEGETSGWNEIKRHSQRACSVSIRYFHLPHHFHRVRVSPIEVHAGPKPRDGQGKRADHRKHLAPAEQSPGVQECYRWLFERGENKLHQQLLPGR